MSKVSLVKIENCFKESIKKSVKLINYEYKKINNIVIKPNLCYYWDYSTGNTTDPKFVQAIIEYLKEEINDDIKINIVESDASAMKTKHAFRFLGYEKLLKIPNVNLVNLTELKYKTKKIIVKGNNYEIRIPNIISEADLKINVPKIKYMGEDVKITCALKNIFGCIPQPRKFRYHKNLADMIVAANKAMQFNLIIVDSNIASGARPKKIGLVMSSKDPVSNDFVASKIASVNPQKINYLKLAEKENLGNFDPLIIGESLDHFKQIYPKETFQDHFWSFGYKIYQRIYG